MMVVLFVMGVLAAAVVLALPGDAGKVRAETERLAARTSAARDEAIAGGAPMALVVSGAGYYFEQRRDGAWQPASGRGLGLVNWSEGTHASLVTGGGSSVSGSPTGGRARVVFDPVGLASSEVRLRVSRGSEARTLVIARDGRVRIDNAR